MWEATLSEGKGTPSIRQVVIFFYEDDDNRLHHLQDRWDGVTLEYGYKVLRVWDVHRRQVTDAELIGLYPLLPLMMGDQADETPEQAMKESVSAVEVIDDEALKCDLLATMAILAEGKYPSELVLSFIRREIIMKSAIFQEWASEAEAKGKQEAICQFLSDKFGDISRDLQGRINQIGSVDALNKILIRIFKTDSLNDAANLVDSATE